MNIKQLDDPVTTINGAKIMLTKDSPLTYRSALVSACETYQAEPGSGEMLKAYDLGMKIMNAGDELEMSEDDIKFIDKIVNNNRSFIAVVVGRLHEFINKSN